MTFLALSTISATLTTAILSPFSTQDPAKGDKVLTRPDAIFARPLTFNAPDRRAARRVLSSGAVVYLAPDAAVPRTEVRLYFRAGTYVDPPGREGLTTLVADCLRNGGTKVKPAADVNRELAALGASLDISIGETEGLVLVRCEPAALRASLLLALEVLRDPAFPQEALDKAKQRLLETLAARDDSLVAIENRAWKRLTRGSHFSTRLPSPESLARITLDDLAQYANQFLFARNFLFAVSGAYDESTAVPMLEECLTGFRNRDTPLPIPAEPESPAAPGLYVVDADRPLSTARTRVGFVGFRRDHPDRVPVMALLEYLGGRLSASRLDRVLRAEKGLTWDPASSFVAGDFFPGSYSLHCTTLTADAPAAVKIMLEELRNLGDRPLPDEALAAVRQTLVDRAAALETSASARAGRFALDEIARADAEELSRDRARLEALTTDECLRAARLWLDPAKAIVLVVGDAKTLDSTRAALGAVKPVTGL